MLEREQEPGLQRIECDDCGAPPEVYWDREIETVALACECGERMVPRDTVLEHDMMQDGATWTVVEGDN